MLFLLFSLLFSAIISYRTSFFFQESSILSYQTVYSLLPSFHCSMLQSLFTIHAIPKYLYVLTCSNLSLTISIIYLLSVLPITIVLVCSMFIFVFFFESSPSIITSSAQHSYFREDFHSFITSTKLNSSELSKHSCLRPISLMHLS